MAIKPYYQHQLFFCINRRNSEKACCANKNAESYFLYAKQQLKKLAIHGPLQCRVNSSSCLGRCEEGPVLVIYPEGIWYSYKTYTDIDDIIEQHILQGRVLKRLQLENKFSAKNPPKTIEGG